MENLLSRRRRHESNCLVHSASSGLCQPTRHGGGGTPLRPPLVLCFAIQQDPSQDANNLLKQAYDTKSAGKRADALTLFEKIMQEFPDTSAGAEARWMVACYRLADKRFDEAEQLFQQVAVHKQAPADIAAESLLQTGFVFISRYWAEAQSPGPARMRLLQTAAGRLRRIAQEASSRSDPFARTVWGYALLGVGESYLYQGAPDTAEPYYRQIVQASDGVHPAVVAQAWYALGVSLFRQRRYGEALQAFEAVKQMGAKGEGIVLRSLALGNALPERAGVWQAVIWASMGNLERSSLALEQSLQSRERLADASNKAFVARVERSLERLRRVVALVKERERRLAEAGRIARELEQGLPAGSWGVSGRER